VYFEFFDNVVYISQEQIVYNMVKETIYKEIAMGSFIEKSLEIADEKFKSFGFSDTQREQLLASGRRDLEKEISRLEELLASNEPDIASINQTLHALKGLLYNMGNTEAGDIMAELKDDAGRPDQLKKIREILS
jgi:hypothetical protein